MKIKLLISVLAIMAAALLLTSCFDDPSPYSGYDESDYNVSVKYDANGGFFSTNTSIIVDTYNLSKLPSDSSGNKKLTLISPDDEVRKSENAFVASKAGHFLVGWYTEKTAVTDEQGNELDANGNIASVSGEEVAYKYSGRWDFENGTYAVDPKKEYTASEPVLTLYAAWLPEFSFEFYDLDTGKLLKSYDFDPMYIMSMKLPEWNMTTGELDMHEFPTVDNMTYNNVYYDPAGEQPVTGTTVTHTGTIDAEAVTQSGEVMKLYVDMLDGKWYNIYNVDQFIKNASPTGNYNILADLDFEGKPWSTTLMHGDFSGTIKGNGYTISNITISQTDIAKVNTGLFGALTSSATIENVIFENITLNITAGSRLPNASFGLFAGTVAAGATLENLEISGKLVITPSPLITESTTIGVFCGEGTPGTLDISGIRVEVLPPADEYTDPITVVVSGNTVTVVTD